MEKLTSLYGLTVRCGENQHIEYENLKEELEREFHKLERALVTAEHKGICAYYTLQPVTEDKHLSFFITGQELQIGLYDRTEKEIISRCDFDDIKNLKLEDISYLAYTAKNYIDRGIDMTSDKNPVLSAWGHEEVKRRLQMNLNANKAAVSKSNQMSPFKGTMDDLIKNAMNRAHTQVRTDKYLTRNTAISR